MTTNPTAPTPLTSEELNDCAGEWSGARTVAAGCAWGGVWAERLIATAQNAADKAERIAAEAYQVIGAIADAAGMFDTPEVQRALSYFSGEEMGGGILPYTSPNDLDADKVSLETEVLSLRAALSSTQAMLSKAADQFAYYADEHAKEKGPKATAKAMTNHSWALACAKADHIGRRALGRGGGDA